MPTSNLTFIGASTDVFPIILFFSLIPTKLALKEKIVLPVRPIIPQTGGFVQSNENNFTYLPRYYYFPLRLDALYPNSMQ